MSTGFSMRIENASGVVDDVTAVVAPEVVDAVIEAVAVTYGWTPGCSMTKARFFSYQVRRWAVQVLAGYHVNKAQETAAAAAMAQVVALEDSIVFKEPVI
jgi:predicted component of type VI protein secretion system